MTTSTSESSAADRSDRLPIRRHRPVSVCVGSVGWNRAEDGMDRKTLTSVASALRVLWPWVSSSHVHYIVPAGGLSADRSDGSWARAGSSCQSGPSVAGFGSSSFRACAIYIRMASSGSMAPSNRSPILSPSPCSSATDKGWVVYAKPPFGGPDQVLNYLARYTHRVAISNYRLLELRDGQVSFLWRDYNDGGLEKTMTISAHEFLRRFLLHFLPRGLVRIRHFGLFANRKRSATLARCRLLLGIAISTDPPVTPELRCPICSGTMLIVERLTSAQLYLQAPATPPIRRSAFDTS